MRVYELMAELSKLPSGTEVFCTAALTVNEVESGIVIDDEDEDNILYEVSRPLDNLDTNGNRVYLGF